MGQTSKTLLPIAAVSAVTCRLKGEMIAFQTRLLKMEAPEMRLGTRGEFYAPGLLAGFYLEIFFLGGVFVFLQGVLAKMDGRRWLFCGEFVVESW
jgi:hypothetical protein